MTTLVQVRGTIRAPDNTPAPDLVVTFRLSGPLLDAASDLLVEPVTVRADVSPLGVFAVSLAANDDPALQPTGSTYLVSVSARGTSESRSIIVPLAGAALGVELADIATAVPGPLVFSYALSSTVTALDARVVVLEAGGGGAGAVETHRADTTVVHGIADTTALVLTSDARLTGNQPLDSDLTAIAALTTTAFGRSFLDRADADAGRTLVGLGSVDNTADADKPVSTAQAAANVADQARANHTGTQSADTLTDGTTIKAFLATERTKLAGIATGATANSSDAVLLVRANHTGTQAFTTITGTVPDAQIDAAIARDTEVSAAVAAAALLVANTQTASYTLVLADGGKVVEQNVAAANTLTVPPNSSVSFPVGTLIEVHQYGAGQVTITAGAGVTLRSSGAKLKTAAQYASVSLRKRGTDEWVVAGDLVA